MSDVLGQAKHRLAIGLDRNPLFFEPLIADQWVIKSLLQKSIRRGEVEVAQRAALTLLAQKGSAIWRRFIIIAFEDIGAGSADVVAMTVAASTNSTWRKRSGGDAVVASHLARLLAEAPMPKSNRNSITTETGEQVPARPHNSGSAANETVDGLDATTEAIRHATEDTPSGTGPGDIEKTPVFDRAGHAPKI